MSEDVELLEEQKLQDDDPVSYTHLDVYKRQYLSFKRNLSYKSAVTKSNEF